MISITQLTNGWLLTLDGITYVMTWVGDRLLTTGVDVCYWVYEVEGRAIVEACQGFILP